MEAAILKDFSRDQIRKLHVYSYWLFSTCRKLILIVFNTENFKFSFTGNSLYYDGYYFHHENMPI